MIVRFINPGHTRPFYFCPINDPKGFKLSSNIIDALTVTDRKLIRKELERLREQSGLRVELQRQKSKSL